VATELIVNELERRSTQQGANIKNGSPEPLWNFFVALASSVMSSSLRWRAKKLGKADSAGTLNNYEMSA